MIRRGTELRLIAPVERTGDGEWSVRSPGVGWWSGAPEPGELVGEGSRLGSLEQLNRAFVLLLGAGAAGRVVDGDLQPGIQGVEFGQELFRMRALAGGDAATGADDEARVGPSSGDRVVVAPTDGVFYRRPAPDAPLFVKVGDRIRHGQPVGLIEVMKTFNQILYEAADPAAGAAEVEVLEVRDEDAGDVRAGDVLLVVRDV